MIDFHFYLITDRRRCAGRPLIACVEEACRAGVRAVQVREKDLSARDLYTLAKALRAVTQRYQARLFINDRVDIALAVGADGVHCRETSLSPGVVRRIAPGLLLGVSVHAEDTARRAAQQGADFVLFGPVFDTPAKRPYGPPQGLKALESLAEKIDIPVFAVGGESTWSFQCQQALTTLHILATKLL